MAKLRKYERVSRYLNRQWTLGQLNREKLTRLHHSELVALPEMEGIGARTISNVLKDFKKQQGALSKPVAVSKKAKVRDFLDYLLATGEETRESLLEMNYMDLVNRREMMGIGKTTVGSVLREYKRRFEKRIFEDNILNYIQQETEVASEQQPTDNKTKRKTPINGTSYHLNSQDVDVLKTMIDLYKHRPDSFVNASEHELNELKAALSYFGIDFKLILEHYWNNGTTENKPVNKSTQLRDKYGRWMGKASESTVSTYIS